MLLESLCCLKKLRHLHALEKACCGVWTNNSHHAFHQEVAYSNISNVY
jgi:hypothetical protein